MLLFLGYYHAYFSVLLNITVFYMLLYINKSFTLTYVIPKGT